MLLPTHLLPLVISLLSLIMGYDEAELIFAGDAMQHSAQLDAARRPGGSYDYSGCFDSIAPLLNMADFAVVNLETPVGDPPYTGYPCFNAPESFAKALSDAGFDLMLTANNHTLDRRSKGLRRTISALDDSGIAHIGTYVNDSTRNETVPAIFNINGIHTAFLNYTYGTNGFTPSDDVVVNYIEKEQIRHDVQLARFNHADIVIVCIHWGDEYRLLPNSNQKELADWLEELGVDMVIGAHPHVIQPMELRPNRFHPDRNFFLVYSLGNFISNMRTPDTRGGAMASVRRLRRNDGIARIVEASYIPVFTIASDRQGSNYRVVEAEKVNIPVWRERAADFLKRARNIFDNHNINVPRKNAY